MSMVAYYVYIRCEHIVTYVIIRNIINNIHDRLLVIRKYSQNISIYMQY